MEQTWRWFGPKDKVTLQDARHAGAEGIVTALHEIPVGTPWSIEDICDRQAEITAAGLRWSVVESLDVTEAIKTRINGRPNDIDAFIQSLRNLAACGIFAVVYNFMPVFSWMRTDLHTPLPHGGYTTSFSATAFAAFDICILRRHDAEKDWGENRTRAACEYYAALTHHQRESLQSTILQVLPGGNGSFSLHQVLVLVERYREIDGASFRENAGEFLRTVCPVASRTWYAIMCSSRRSATPSSWFASYCEYSGRSGMAIAQSPEESNGITFCTGALGIRADNNLLAMAKRFAHRIGFAHLRSTRRDEVDLTHKSPMESFWETPHLEGDADLIGVMVELVKEERRRTVVGDSQPLPFRPDHGQELLNDRERGAHAGYPAVGRLRGLAELRGVMRTSERLLPEG